MSLKITNVQKQISMRWARNEITLFEAASRLKKKPSSAYIVMARALKDLIRENAKSR